MEPDQAQTSQTGCPWSHVDFWHIIHPWLILPRQQQPPIASGGNFLTFATLATCQVAELPITTLGATLHLPRHSSPAASIPTSTSPVCAHSTSLTLLVVLGVHLVPALASTRLVGGGGGLRPLGWPRLTILSLLLPSSIEWVVDELVCQPQQPLIALNWSHALAICVHRVDATN